MDTAPFLLHEQGPGDVDALDLAWAGEPTFAFLPAKSAVASEWVQSTLDALPDDLRTNHFALLTSGSTGHPKLIIGSRARAENLARVLHEVQLGEACSETILTLPLSYCYAFVNQWLWARVMGRRTVSTRGFAEPGELRAALENADAAMLCLVGAQLSLFETHMPGTIFPAVERVHFAGGPFPQGQLGAIRARFPNARIFNNYGCAEAMPRLTIRPAEDGDSASDIGRALPGVELAVADDRNGELTFRSDYGAVAFVEQPGGLRRLGASDWIPTGDCAEDQGEGRFRLLGRANQVFKRYGEKIALGRLLETAGAVWPGQATFYREKDRMNEEGFVLLLAPAPADEQLRAILMAYRANHPRTHWPLRVESVEHLPTLPSGKPDLAALANVEGRQVHWRNRI